MFTPSDKKAVFNKTFHRTLEMILFAILGAMMFCSKILMEFLPNIHLLGMLTMTYTVVFRQKALIPIYVYVMLNGLYAGFNVWWVPYLYIWTILWAVTMLIPQRTPKKIKCIVYPAICCLHGLLFGAMYAPAYALMFRMNWQSMIAWIIYGLPWDAVHGVGNLIAGMLILPLSELMIRLLKRPHIS